MPEGAEARGEAEVRSDRKEGRDRPDRTPVEDPEGHARGEIYFGRTPAHLSAIPPPRGKPGEGPKAKGKVKETVGILTGDKKMEREGSLQRAEGAVQEGLGKAGRKIGEAMTNLGNAIKK